MGTREKLSRGANSGGSCHQTNSECHGWQGKVQGNQHHVMASPRVYAIYWDQYFQHNPAVNLMNRFFGDILRGTFMRQLTQYGVGNGVFAGSSTIDPGRQPEFLEPQYIEEQLKEWIKRGTVQVSPTENETNLLYVIFTPNHTSISHDGYCTCGYHQSGHYGILSGDDNLFWAAIQEWHHNNDLPGSDREFLDLSTWCVSHEMVEAFTNRDGKGYHTDTGCEIGDICECAQGSEAQKTPIIKAQVGEWWVETYWDNQNQSCYPLHVTPRAVPPTAGYERPAKGADQ